jgi:hypothetical protein
MVRHQISQTSGVKILPLARMERGFVSKSGARDARFRIFATEISRSSRIETYELRDLSDVYNGLEWMC